MRGLRIRAAGYYVRRKFDNGSPCGSAGKGRRAGKNCGKMKRRSIGGSSRSRRVEHRPLWQTRSFRKRALEMFSRWRSFFRARSAAFAGGFSTGSFAKPQSSLAALRRPVGTLRRECIKVCGETACSLRWRLWLRTKAMSLYPAKVSKIR